MGAGGSSGILCRGQEPSGRGAGCRHRTQESGIPASPVPLGRGIDRSTEPQGRGRRAGGGMPSAELAMAEAALQTLHAAQPVLPHPGIQPEGSRSEPPPPTPAP